MKILILLLLTSLPVYSFTHKINKELVTKNAFEALSRIIPISFKRFLPKASKDLTILRFEPNGIIDFLYTSQTGNFKGNFYCELSRLIQYNKNLSVARETCFRTNIHAIDKKAINGLGRQVGIY